jgi:hypothetical protein
MIVVRFGLVIAVMVAALFLIVAGRTVDTADRVLGRTAATDPAAVIAKVKRKLGPDAELLDITFTGNSGNVKYRDGDGAAGLQWGPGRVGLERANVTLIGEGRLADNVFPIARLDPAAPARLTAAAGVAFELHSMTLRIDPATGRVRWTVTGERNGRARVLTARSDASGLRRDGRYRPRA